MTRQEVIIGNALDVLKGMESESVDVVVTSPPYWALRDYGSEPQVWGGDAGCEHVWEENVVPARGGVGENANVGANRDGEANNCGHPTVTHYCARCGAWRGQLGLEPSPGEYIDHLMMIFDEVQRVLRPTGSCWVNIGDTYNGHKKGNTETRKNTKVVSDSFEKPIVGDIGPKCMCMIPERFAIAMCDHGWILRNKVVWMKPNQMPSSATDRFTQDYEPFYFFTKSPRDYWFNQLKENGSVGSDGSVTGGRVMRCVWGINTQPNSMSHVAMFPTSLVDRPLRACCPPGGVVLDPFCGSGTVLEYCFEHDLNGIGIEVNPDFEDMIKRRMKAGQSKLSSFAEESNHANSVAHGSTAIKGVEE